MFTKNISFVNILYATCSYDVYNIVYVFHITNMGSYKYVFLFFIFIIYFLSIHLNIYMQDLKPNSAWLLHVVLLYNKTMWVHQKYSFLYILLKLSWVVTFLRWGGKTVPWNGALVHKWISECFNIWFRYNNIHITCISKACISVMIFACH